MILARALPPAPALLLSKGAVAATAGRPPEAPPLPGAWSAAPTPSCPSEWVT